MHDSSRFLLDDKNAHRVTEHDFIVPIWVPVLKAIADIKGSLRLKIGESSPEGGVKAKKAIYQDATVEFKVDIRVLFDSPDNEHDLLAVEVAKAADDAKLHHDLSKLLREAKDNLDANQSNILEHYVEHPSAWFGLCRRSAAKVIWTQTTSTTARACTWRCNRKRFGCRRTVVI
ncbi:hypothetical protein BCR43DRAFT_308543 [Syncephalastrum racemosum]|uniref:Uncharacterized protein n=1 Tax=Syncephalastrum racemosum TaxID=13706 RepID=A0A1X2HAF3_SYNRA|nr:hypothetical protein BCR43DRAFT_308543 [Syncephalastrum racemosum]